MTALIVGGLALVTLLVLALIAYRVTRRPEHVPPRRREFNRLRERNASAQRTVNDVKKVLDEYNGTLDAVGNALLYDVRELIRKHDQEMLEIDR